MEVLLPASEDVKLDAASADLLRQLVERIASAFHLNECTVDLLDLAPAEAVPRRSPLAPSWMLCAPLVGALGVFVGARRNSGLGRGLQLAAAAVALHGALRATKELWRRRRLRKFCLELGAAAEMAACSVLSLQAAATDAIDWIEFSELAARGFGAPVPGPWKPPTALIERSGLFATKRSREVRNSGLRIETHRSLMTFADLSEKSTGATDPSQQQQPQQQQEQEQDQEQQLQQQPPGLSEIRSSLGLALDFQEQSLLQLLAVCPGKDDFASAADAEVWLQELLRFLEASRRAAITAAAAIHESLQLELRAAAAAASGGPLEKLCAEMHSALIASRDAARESGASFRSRELLVERLAACQRTLEKAREALRSEAVLPDETPPLLDHGPEEVLEGLGWSLRDSRPLRGLVSDESSDTKDRATAAAKEERQLLLLGDELRAALAARPTPKLLLADVHN
ncbi:unnamed protein product [Polarella glacialis]|uniref:Uncharacterized protein n=3 Tax=Polarella glacialis TaxID=89957 RepID=A0A813L715_POLGL|nr:unnamed protein product [Polarella glacialis]